MGGSTLPMHRPFANRPGPKPLCRRLDDGSSRLCRHLPSREAPEPHDSERHDMHVIEARVPPTATSSSGRSPHTAHSHRPIRNATVL